MISRLSFAFLVVALSASACGGGGSDDTGDDDTPTVDAGPADASPACAEALTYQDFTSIQENIFKRQCAFMDCHDSGQPEADMDLTGATAHGLLVNHETVQDVADGWMRVVPGMPAQSYLMVALGEIDGPIDPDVGTMPQNSPLICQEKRDAIERWILAGAPND